MNSSLTADLTGKRILITGGNSGVGKAAAIGLARLGATVVISSRDAARGAAALAEVKAASKSDAVSVVPLDLASFASIRACAKALVAEDGRLDVLVNNAGLVLSDRRETVEGFEATLGVNHLGHFLLTDLLLDALKSSAPSRIINVASDAHRSARRGLNFDDLQRTSGYSGMSAYGESKLANILYSRELARRLDGTGVVVHAMHPGLIRSGFGMDGDTKLVSLFYKIGGAFMKTPVDGADTIVWLASEDVAGESTGGYWYQRKPRRMTKWAEDDEAAKRLWTESERMIASASA